MSSQLRSVPVRRNGRLQACEPCRKRKLACDHGLPVCHRCQKRKKPSECVYLAAPLTLSSAKNHTRPSLTGPPATEAPSTTNHQQCSTYRAVGGPKRPGKVLEQAPRSSHLFTTPNNYFGSTSFTAVFWENQHNIERALPPGQTLQVTSEQIQASSVAEVEAVLDFPSRTSRKILQRIPSQETCQILLARAFQGRDNWIDFGLQHCQDMLWSTHGDSLNGTRNNEDLERLARVLHKNATKPLLEPDDPVEWLDAFSGSNIRWEALGILFCGWMYGTLNPLSTDESLFPSSTDSKRDKKQFQLRLMNSVIDCVNLCSETDTVNPLIVHLLFRRALLHSIINGDTSVLLWRTHGDFICALTALGLHRESEVEQAKVSLAKEYRRRLFSVAFQIDKSIASFTGRPPVLSYRYCTSRMPLDVSSHALLSTEANLTKVASTLSADGWNTDGQIYAATKLRMCMQLARIRDEILEISLGNQEALNVERMKELRLRAEKTYLAFPAAIILHPSESHKNDDEYWNKMSVRIRHLLNMFLIDQFLSKFGATDGQVLLDTSREQLALILVLWTERDRFTSHWFDYEWIYC
ncbi:MAG: hypothetical protein M1818_001675 [Claussenomyces sp. TS43310]|nr:MAG: hypothetical protein M1818_001675 [Claussenomyces sp. TS43310]